MYDLNNNSDSKESRATNIRRKIIKVLSYIAIVGIGFMLYYNFRTQVVPIISSVADIQNELKRDQEKFPVSNADKSVVIEKMTYTDDLHVKFYIATNQITVLEVQKVGTKAFNNLNLRDAFCNNSLSQLIIKKHGSISVEVNTLDHSSNLFAFDLECEYIKQESK